MGARGPVPKRSAERRRRNTAEVAVQTAPAGAAPPAVPVADPQWHPVAVEWFTALAGSGQSRFYEASDWAVARYLAEGMSRNLHAERFSAQLFAAVMSGMTELLVTEGSRRRARLELERAKPGAAVEPEGVTALNDYRRTLTG